MVICFDFLFGWLIWLERIVWAHCENSCRNTPHLKSTKILPGSLLIPSVSCIVVFLSYSCFLPCSYGLSSSFVIVIGVFYLFIFLSSYLCFILITVTVHNHCLSWLSVFLYLITVLHSLRSYLSLSYLKSSRILSLSIKLSLYLYIYI
jgi:hypothetical protein